MVSTYALTSDAMRKPGVPPEAFMAIRFDGPMPHGDVSFDKAFEATGPVSVP
jgi:predicted N-acetyltransferase YhbS